MWAGWGDLGDSRGGKHDPGHTANTLRPVYLLNPGEGGNPKRSLTLPNVSYLQSVLSWSSWVLNPTVYPLYPGASADYSSPPCCVPVCIGRMGSEQQIPRPGPVSPLFLHSAQRHLLAEPELTRSRLCSPEQCFPQHIEGPGTSKGSMKGPWPSFSVSLCISTPEPLKNLADVVLVALSVFFMSLFVSCRFMINLPRNWRWKWAFWLNLTLWHIVLMLMNACYNK